MPQLSKCRTHRQAPAQHRVPHFRQVSFPCSPQSKFPSGLLAGIFSDPSDNACFLTPHQPAHMPQTSHSPVQQRPPPLPNHHHALATYSHVPGQYGPVKVEDDHYNVGFICSRSVSPLLTTQHPQSSHQNANHAHYSLPSFAQTAPDHDMDHWQYSGRQLQR